MYLTLSSFVALSPGGDTWETTWESLLRRKALFRSHVSNDRLVSWPEGPPMGIIDKWPDGRTPSYLSRTPALLMALATSIDAAVDRIEKAWPATRWGLILGSSHSDPGPSALCADGGLTGLRKSDLHRVVSTELGDSFLSALKRDWPVWVVHGACASGLLALQTADDLLACGVIDAAVVACSDTLSRVAYAGFNRVGAMSPMGSIPFDAGRNGMTLSEAGAAMICTRDQGPGKQVALKGISVYCDRSGTVEPSAEAVEKALQECLIDSDLEPYEVDFVYWHGTGTILNDRAEYAAAMRVFTSGPPPGTSIKGVLGHTMGASALLNVMAACETLYSGLLPGASGVSKPAFPDLAITTATHHIAMPRSGMSVALGFGGINAAAVLSRPQNSL